ncbi:hypothetical protein [Ekhidna sp.]|uniref:hypothetical protein n=1 Tax=Ekhidna sp. TaxID=2608089 RepID=UPI00329989CC
MTDWNQKYCTVKKNKSIKIKCAIINGKTKITSTKVNPGYWVKGAFVKNAPNDNSDGVISRINHLGNALYYIYLDILKLANPLNPKDIASVDLREFVDKQYKISKNGDLVIPSFDLVKQVLGVSSNDIESRDFDKAFLEIRYSIIHEELSKTTSEEEEKRIIAALSDLSVEEFYQLMRKLASNSMNNWRGKKMTLLEFLYTDLSGDNLNVYLQLYRTKMICYRANSLEGFEKFYNEALDGQHIVGSYQYRTGFKYIRNYPEDSKYDLKGNVITTWNHHEGIVPPWNSSTATMSPISLARINYEDNAPYAIISAPEMHALQASHALDAWLDKLTIVTLVSGISAVSLARTVAGRTAAVVLGIVHPIADALIRKYQKEISEMENGPAFLKGWDIFNYALLGFGILQITKATGKIVVNRINKHAKNLKAKNSQQQKIIDELVTKIDDLASNILKKKNEIDALRSRVTAVPNSLENTVKRTHVYLGIDNGEIRYVGITVQDLLARQAQHVAKGKTFTIARITTREALSRRQARAIEQVIINKNRIENITSFGGLRMFNLEFANAINSISPSRKWYAEAVSWAESWLKLHNYL